MYKEKKSWLQQPFKFSSAAAALAVYAACATALPSPVQATEQAPAEAVYMYRGADRDQVLVEKAKEEGRVTWYTTMAPSESRPMAEAFEKKYGIKVDLWRASGEQLVQRIVTEARAQRFTLDIIEGQSKQTEILAREDLVSQFYSPFIDDLPAIAIPEHRKWMPDRMNYLVVAYNTRLVKRDEIPTTYEGFLDPKWKGRIALEASDFVWMDAVSDIMGKDKGPEYFRKLADFKPDLRKGHPLLAKLIGAGEVPVGLTAYLANVESAKRAGEPIDWVPVEPVMGVSFSIALAKHAPNPHAALLLADFILSPEGQGMLSKMGRIPASTKVDNPLVSFPYSMIDVDDSLDEGGVREKAWNDLFVTRR